MGRMDKIGRTGTEIIRDDAGAVFVRYHETDVVSFDDSSIILKTGGWYTQTTKARMNQASTVYGLGYRVYQEKGVFWVNYKGGLYPFIDDQVRLER